MHSPKSALYISKVDFSCVIIANQPNYSKLGFKVYPLKPVLSGVFNQEIFSLPLVTCGTD